MNFIISMKKKKKKNIISAIFPQKKPVSIANGL